MAQALERAGLHPPDIGLIAAHATGTADNDAAERAAMAAVFAHHLRNIPVVGFKSHLGHTLGGAGAVELILSLMALNHQTIPPCANVSADDIEFPELSVVTGQARTASIRATLNTSLGFGGANTCVILTKPTDAADRAASGQSLQRLRSALSSGNSHYSGRTSATREVLISGIGVVVGGIVGNEAFGRRIERPGGPAWQGHWPQISDAELEGLINARRVRRMSQYVKLQLAAATIACRQAEIADISTFAQDCAAVVGTMHGSAGYSLSYYQQIVSEGIGAANPMLFAEAVPNSGAAQLSLMLGLRGACQSIIGTRTSGLDALNLAASRIASGVWDRAIVGAGEEQCPIIEQAYQHCGLAATSLPAAAPFAQDHGFCMACGSVAVVLESAQSLERRGGRALARLTSWAAGRGERGGDLPNTLARCIHQLGQIDGIVSSACGTWIDRAEALAIRRAEFGGVVSSIYGHVPELFSAMPLAGLAAVLLSGRMPRLSTPAAQLGFSPASGGETPRCFAVLCSDFAGSVAATRIELPG
jgi:3-oxoacyl-[acyl-carrier-protein] synthase II